MKKILLVHGPNLNMLGVRDQKHYGNLSLATLEATLKKGARDRGISITAFQSNCEGKIIDFLQKHTRTSFAILINPGALTHYSYALHDALVDTGLPAVEVHLSDIKNRESWRKISVTAPACKKVISGKKLAGYIEALDFLLKN